MKKRLAHLPSGLFASAVLLVVGVILGALLRGGTGAAGAAAGVTLVAVSYTLSSLMIAWADSVHPRMVMPVGLTTYVVKFILIGVVMAAISATGWPGLPAMGIAIIATALGWTTAQAVWTWRARIPYVEIDGS
jgi:ATP synthase protein I